MSAFDIQTLVKQYRSGEISRRGFMKQASTLGISAAVASTLAKSTSAQDATPDVSPAASPAASPVAGGTRSITRDEYYAQLREQFDLQEPGQTGGDLVYVQTSDIRTLNPQLYTDVYSGLISSFVYDFLAVESAIDGTPVPGLADYWELGDDGVTYTFHINQNATWHDGEPVTADDVIFSLESLLDEESLSVRRSTVMEALSEYRRVDDKTVQLIGHQPFATFVQDTAAIVGIVPRHIWQDVPVAQWGSDPGATGQDPARVVGSGPFRFVEWVTGDHATMERNADYWDPERTPVIDRFIYQVVGEASTALAQLQTGQADISEIEFSNADTLRESNPELNIVDFDTTGFNYFLTNQDESKGTIFTDTKLRQALLYALDRDLIAETVYQGYAVRAVGTQPVLSIAYRPDEIETDYVFDPDKAMALLDESGWVPGNDGVRVKDGRRLSFEVIFAEGTATYEQQIPYMQQAWREIGAEMIPGSIPFPTLIDRIIAGNFEMAVSGFSWSVDGGQGDMFRCDATPPNGFNRMRYCNEEYDRLDELQRTELDVEERIDILIEQSNIVNNDAAVGITVFTKDILGSAPRVRNFYPNGYSNFWSLPYIWIEQS